MREGLRWRWHRLRAMSPGEIALRFQRKAFQIVDPRRRDWHSGALEPDRSFPSLPARGDAPRELAGALARDAENILAGRWTAFGHLPLKVDDPPRWQFDHLAGVDLRTSRSAFRLDHRKLPGGADIKVVWEPNRWHALTRLAMAAWLLENARARDKCLDWLRDWTRENPPFTGLNWTSALETGIRLIQWVWIDELLLQADAPPQALAEVRRRVLPAHVHYTWRYRTFGSSANNHLLGELAGLIVAAARWPELERKCQSFERLAGSWGREVLAQFAVDGGNNEQALGYHLFALEFCWLVRAALLSRGLRIPPPVEERLERAIEFFCALHQPNESWPYGDADDACAAPFYLNEQSAAREWWDWLAGGGSPAPRFWWGEVNRRPAVVRGRWRLFEESGHGVFATGAGGSGPESAEWFARFDGSPLGYLSTAAHGHLDALHFSLWHNGRAVVIDPGTGTYYGDAALREYLSGWRAHNGPHPPGLEIPRRLGRFLWAEHHSKPVLRLISETTLSAELPLPVGTMQRTVEFLPGQNGWRIEDSFAPQNSDARFLVHWQFPPGSVLEPLGMSEFRLVIGAEKFMILTDPRWSRVEMMDSESNYTGLCSPSFRRTERGPFLLCRWNGPGEEKLHTSFQKPRA